MLPREGGKNVGAVPSGQGEDELPHQNLFCSLSMSFCVEIAQHCGLTLQKTNMEHHGI